MKKHSIRIQFALVTILLIAATIGISLLANVFFLEKVYTKDKKQSLIETYQLLDKNCDREKLTDENFIAQLDSICGKYNLNMIILDERNYPILYSTMNLDALSNKLGKYLWGQNAPLEILEGTSYYMVQTSMDARVGKENMEMWGTLKNGYTFLFTTPLESIEESVAISNRFMRNIGLAAALVCGIVAWIYSRKISQPILKLADFSERLTKLDFEAKYTGNDKNEIGVLGNNMNTLSKSLEGTISELKTANIELLQDVQRKQELNEKRQEFIGNVSHELKTPIALIQGYAEGLKEGVISDEESRNYYLDVICDEADRMNRMVKNLMTLNELESGDKQITVERFDIVALVRNYIANAGLLLKDIDAKVSFSAPESLFVWSDEFKVEEIVMNYFSNAVHHVARPVGVEDDSVKPEIRICITDKDDKAKVTVFNTGKPIPEADLEHIWDKFYKVDKARTRAYGGSGVGLSIVKAIATSLNEECGVENVENGVTFWFTLSTK